MTTSMPARSKPACALSGNQTWIHVGHGRVQLRHTGVDEDARVGMVDDVHVDRHPLALGEQPATRTGVRRSAGVTAVIVRRRS